MPTCPCSAAVPDSAAPAHPYLPALPGCWEAYGRLLARLDGGVGAPLQVDAYAAQHAVNPAGDRRQRGSVAVHLVVLCAVAESDLRPEAAPRFRTEVSRRVLPRIGGEWPELEPPAEWGELSAAAIERLPHDELLGACSRWAGEVWAAWAPLDTPVRAWTTMALDGGR